MIIIQMGLLFCGLHNAHFTIYKMDRKIGEENDNLHQL